MDENRNLYERQLANSEEVPRLGGKFEGHFLMTDRNGGCLYCAKPLLPTDTTCPACGWDGEYPITKTTTPFLMDDHKAAMHQDSIKTTIPPRPRPVGSSNTTSATNAHEERMLRWFTYDHLPPNLQAVSAPFCELVALLAHTLKPGPERTVTFRKLLEAKDAAVRAALHPGA